MGDIKVLKEKLEQEASENLGMTMVYTLVTSAKEWLFGIQIFLRLIHLMMILCLWKATKDLDKDPQFFIHPSIVLGNLNFLFTQASFWAKNGSHAKSCSNMAQARMKDFALELYLSWVWRFANKKFGHGAGADNFGD
ncbi:RWD domain-containing protein 1 [Forsythia ovata]|uniref:RWD domain-containing protein 1 n=1 Tax=Forsythia ovata TaxID=205694 RepID=A0ABD1VNZ0_9LAMI